MASQSENVRRYNLVNSVYQTALEIGDDSVAETLSDLLTELGEAIIAQSAKEQSVLARASR